MDCREKLLAAMDQAASKNRFPVWDRDPDFALTGAMRVSGFHAAEALALVFEKVEYSTREGMIQNIATCIAVPANARWIAPGNGILVPNDRLMHPKTGANVLMFGPIQVASRGRTFNLELGKPQLVERGCLPASASRPTVEALLWTLCDTLPADDLFSEPTFLVKTLGLAAGARRVFALEAWEHPSAEIYESGEVPSRWPDLALLAEAVCLGQAPPPLSRPPNTHWRHWPLASA